MSQVELARRTGLSTKHVSQIATGKVALSIAIALRFEAALGVDAAEWMRAEVARRRGVAGPLVLEAVEA
jgi:HTH-type transcriptional regulator/antitoxin HigA